MRMLVAEGIVSRDQFEEAARIQATRGGQLDARLVELGAIDEQGLLRYLVRRFPVTHWPAARLKVIASAAVRAVPGRLAVALRVMPLALASERLTLGITDPSRGHAFDEVRHHTGLVVVPALLAHGDLDWALRYYYPAEAGGDSPEPEERPLPLTERVTREMMVPAPAGPVGGGSGGADSIEDAMRAIPLVTRSPGEERPEAERDPGARDTVRFRKPHGSQAAGRSAPAAVAVAGAGKKAAFDTARIRTLGPDSRAETASRASEPAGAGYRVPGAAERGGGAVLRRPIERVGAGAGAAPVESKPIRSIDDSWVAAALSPAPGGEPGSGKIRQAPGRREARRDSDPERDGQARRGPSEGELIDAIARSDSRDEAISLALRYLLRLADRAAFFVVRRGEIRGFDIDGQDTSKESIRSFWIPATAPSALARAVEDREMQLGPLTRHPADGVLSAALGGRPDRALVIPVLLRSRVVGLFYADGLRVDVPPWSRLTRLAEAVAGSLSRAILSGARR
ncbi:MAG: hypothetical protein R6V85_10085 [Polyangia bacterium]